MQANRYDQAAEAPILNTYVPINFGELYRIGQAQKETVEDAMNNIGNAITTFGEFRSPSTIDTQNYYNKSIGQISDLIEKAAANPELIKDSGFRMQFQSRINNLDYASLSMLKESADMQRLGLQTRAQMQAEGRYNRNWDRSDIPNYDTLGTGRVFDDITPIRWMSANELSNAYFNDLQNTAMDPVWKNGIKYTRSGVTYDTLYDIASAKFNDLVSTPQGNEYYQEFLQQYGNPEDAKQAFIGMIADSQRDRIRVNEEVDPVFLAQYKHRLTASDNDQNSLLNRTQMLLADSQISRISNFTNLSRQAIADFMQKGSKALTPDEQAQIAKANSKEYRSEILWDNWLPLVVSGMQPQQATDVVSDMLRTPMSQLSAEDYSKINTTGKQDSNGYYSADNTKNFELTRNLVYEEMQFNTGALAGGARLNPDTKNYYSNDNLFAATGIYGQDDESLQAWSLLTDIWNRPNSINNFKVSPVPSQITTERGNYAEQMALIPYDKLRNEFLKQNGVDDQNVDALLQTLGNTVTIGDPKTTTTQRYDDRNNLESTSKSRSNQSDIYIQIPVGTRIQTRGEAAITQDALYNNSRVTTKIKDTQNAKSEYENYGIQ